VNKRRLMVIGSRGFVGAHVRAATRQRFDLISDTGIDITRADTVRAAFTGQQPEIVVLAAAISDIDRCERERERAEAVNVIGPKIVSEECARIGARLLFTSTGAVFDGRRHGYTEDDLPLPLSVYGDTKARAEEIVLRTLPTAAVVRLSLVLGFGLSAGTNSILDKLVVSLRALQQICVPDEYRNPVDIETLCWFLLALADQPEKHGIYHLGSSDSRSRYDLVMGIARRINIPEPQVVRQAESIPGRAPRGRDHFLISAKIAAACGAPVPTSEETLERCINAVTKSNS
jgi:dTDP-4-dehydrorhamnose reductase